MIFDNYQRSAHEATRWRGCGCGVCGIINTANDMPYDPHIREEELKNRVAVDLFPSFDCARILGDVDFCVQPKDAGPTLWETESLLWAEAKAGVRADFAPLFAQLVLTIGGEKTFETHSPPPFLGAFDSEKIAFLPWHAVLDLFFRPDID